MGLGLAWAGIVTMGLGRDLVGSRLHHYLAGYSVFVWVMLLLFALSIVWSRAAQGSPLSRSDQTGAVANSSLRRR